MDQNTRDKVLALMQKDLDVAPAGWADEPLIADKDGRMLTPNQLVQEVKSGTDFGNKYAKEWLRRHELTEKLADPNQAVNALLELLGGEVETEERKKNDLPN